MPKPLFSHVLNLRNTSLVGGSAAGGDLQGTYPNPTLTPAAKSKWQILGSTLTPLGTFANLLTLDTTGNLTVATTGAGSPKINLGARCALESWDGGICSFYVNDSSTLGYNAALASWKLQCDYRGSGPVAYLQYRPASGAYGPQWTFDTLGNLIITGTIGQKASGTTWSNPSDRRLKDAIEDYATGLDAILQQPPRTFVYNGKAGSTAGLRGYGFIADEVESIMPEMVSTSAAKLDPTDEDETEIQTLDQSNLILALVNAVKELASRVAALEGKP